MADRIKPQEPPQQHCELCLREIPGSAGSTMEGDDYVYHFCGAECYQQWQEQQQQEES